MNTTATRRQIETIDNYYYGAVRLVKTEWPCRVDVQHQDAFVDVSGRFPLDRPLTIDEVLDYAHDVAAEYDADVYEVEATVGPEANGLPVVWIVAAADVEFILERMEAERAECLADHGRHNAPSPADLEREAERRFEHGRV